ncbi:DNAJB8 [Symbiodinium sp. CCMP2592]|nr:DNAJB8 [Symbiodinium sp. CCMP2592]
MRGKDIEVQLLKETWAVQERRIHHLKEMVARLKGDAWDEPRRNGRMPEDIGGFREHPPDAAAGGYGYRTPASSRSTVTPEAMSRALREGWQAKLISRSQACMLLGLSRQPLQAEVQKVRKQLALRWHPAPWLYGIPLAISQLQLKWGRITITSNSFLDYEAPRFRGDPEILRSDSPCGSEQDRKRTIMFLDRVYSVDGAVSGMERHGVREMMRAIDAQALIVASAHHGDNIFQAPAKGSSRPPMAKATKSSEDGGQAGQGSQARTTSSMSRHARVRQPRSGGYDLHLAASSSTWRGGRDFRTTLFSCSRLFAGACSKLGRLSAGSLRWRLLAARLALQEQRQA